jgi:putative ABC transport system ATP-binding protein
MLELLGVVKRYRTGSEDVLAVNDVSFTLSAGEMLALQGPSGSGKTTLLLLAAAAVTADQGQVLFRSSDLAQMSGRDVAQYRLQSVGLVAQQTHLMPHVSAVENAATKLVLGGVPVPQAHRQALQWLERVEMSSRADRTPEELSGGERQRVAIARALAGHPPLILADEPTANLDSERSRETVALLSSLARQDGAAVLLVTHDPDAASAADRVIRLRDGRLSRDPDDERHENAPVPRS